MRILGVDFGDRNIGLALSDQLFFTAQPFGVYRLSGEKENAAFFRELVTRQEIGEVVIGFPLRMNGSQGTRAEKTREFAAWLEKTVSRPVVFWDERLTTHQAQGIMQEQKIKGRDKKDVEHQISATIILLGYLERRRLDSHAPPSS